MFHSYCNTTSNSRFRTFLLAISLRKSFQIQKKMEHRAKRRRFYRPFQIFMVFAWAETAFAIGMDCLLFEMVGHSGQILWSHFNLFFKYMHWSKKISTIKKCSTTHIPRVRAGQQTLVYWTWALSSVYETTHVCSGFLDSENETWGLINFTEPDFLWNLCY